MNGKSTLLLSSMISLVLIASCGGFRNLRTYVDPSSSSSSTRKTAPDPVAPPVVRPVGYPQLPGEFFFHDEISKQRSGLPGMVTSILSPTLGCPARMGRGRAMEVFVASRPSRNWAYYLVRRDSLQFLEETPFVRRMPGPEASRRFVEAVDTYSSRVENEGAAKARVILSELSGMGYRPRLLAESWAGAGLSVPMDRKDCARLARSLRGNVEAVVRRQGQGVVPLTPLHVDSVPESGSRVHRLVLRCDRSEPLEGLYALVVMEGVGGGLVDVQFNSVYYQEEDGRPFHFVVAGDLQWGGNDDVMKSVMDFVLTMNMRASHGAKKPEFVIVAGDVVDCAYGSRRNDLAILSHNYARHYLQAYLALVGLRVPCYLVPGNHDGIRFRDTLRGGLDEDGLYGFRSTFGPLYFSFDRGPFRFVCLNSYDLPDSYRTPRRNLEKSHLQELISSKFNLMNWGGGLQANQFRWFRSRMQGLGEGSSGRPLSPVIISHNDPRGSFPGPNPSGSGVWDFMRHWPITGQNQDRSRLLTEEGGEGGGIPVAAPWKESREYHVGHYTPIRRSDSDIRSDEWFEKMTPAKYQGYPGWIRYQQGWHANVEYTGELSDRVPLVPC
ncbi:MAG: metallophosphoesterase family protein, partial [Planctomycetota bacterium]